MEPNKPKQILFTTIAALLLLLLTYVLVTTGDKGKPVEPKPQSQTQSQAPPKEPESKFNKSLHPLDRPGSIWYVVNKKRAIPPDYVPATITDISGTSLDKPAADAAALLIANSATSGVPLKLISGYRSYANQKSLYENYVKQDGQAAADTYSARPGFSEHQTGLAADFGSLNGSCDLEICFADTAGGKWIKDHAHEYGFIIRYEQGKTNFTGYQFEPWHLRYVGKELASELHKNKQTMEEFFLLGAAPSY